MISLDPLLFTIAHYNCLFRFRPSGQLSVGFNSIVLYERASPREVKRRANVDWIRLG